MRASRLPEWSEEDKDLFFAILNESLKSGQLRRHMDWEDGKWVEKFSVNPDYEEND